MSWTSPRHPDLSKNTKHLQWIIIIIIISESSSSSSSSSPLIFFSWSSSAVLFSKLWHIAMSQNPFTLSVYAVIKHQATLSWRSTLTRGGLAVLEHLGRKASWCGAWVDVFQRNMLQPRKPTFSTQLSMVFTNIYQYVLCNYIILYYIVTICLLCI